MNTIITSDNVLNNEGICYRLLYLLSHKCKYILALGLVNKRIYKYVCQYTEARDGCIIGFRTVDGTRHGEWMTGVYAIHYNNGIIVAWEEYITPVPRWCDPSLWSLKRTWRLGQVRELLYKAALKSPGGALCGHTSISGAPDSYHAGGVVYGLNCWYNNCAIESIDITLTGDHTALRKYDWCKACLEELPHNRAGYPHSPQLDTIEQFLVNSPRAVYTHTKDVMLSPYI